MDRQQIAATVAVGFVVLGMGIGAVALANSGPDGAPEGVTPAGQVEVTSTPSPVPTTVAEVLAPPAVQTTTTAPPIAKQPAGGAPQPGNVAPANPAPAAAEETTTEPPPAPAPPATPPEATGTGAYGPPVCPTGQPCTWPTRSG